MLEHLFRTTFSRPSLTAVFLMLNGLILLAAERFRRRVNVPVPAMAASAGAAERDPGLVPMPAENRDRRSVSRISFRRAVGIGSSEILVRLPGALHALVLRCWSGCGVA